MTIGSRVYIPKGRKSHISIHVHDEMTFCGIWTPYGGMWGTGSQEEIEKAASLELCKNCTKLAPERFRK